MRSFQSFRWQRCDSREWKNSWAKVLRTEEPSWKSGPAIWRKAANGEVTTPQKLNNEHRLEQVYKMNVQIGDFPGDVRIPSANSCRIPQLGLLDISQKDMLQQEGWFQWLKHQLLRNLLYRRDLPTEVNTQRFFLEFGRSILSGHRCSNLWARCVFLWMMSQTSDSSAPKGLSQKEWPC